MTDDEFRALLDRHGGNLENWPRAAVRGARVLLKHSVAAQAMLDEMVAVELALSETEPGPPPGLADRIFDAAFGSESARKTPGAARSASLDSLEKPHRLI